MDKETRLEHYKTVLNKYETGIILGGICEILKRINSEDHVDIKEDYPEFHSLKPKDRGLDEYWFGNRKERIDALKKCIAMIEDEIKVEDTVEIITNNSGSRNKVGDVGIVVSIHSDGGVRVQVKDGPTRANWQKLSDLKKVEPSKIKVGDTVEITGIDTSYRHHKPDMEGMVGKSFKVLEIGSNDAKLDTNDLMEWFPLSVLEKVVIKVGNTVKITRKAVGDELDKAHWVQSMYEWVGKDGVVKEISGSLVKVTRPEDFWWFPLCVLEKVVTNTSQISTSSDILSTNGVFKIGDTVEIIGNTSLSKNKVGDVGVITDLHGGGKQSAAVQVSGGPTTCNYSLVTELKKIDMKKKVVIDGVEHELDLTPEQLAIVSKPTALPVSWEEVYEIDAPDWCVKCDGVVVDDMAGYVGMDKMNIASKARGKSLAAYAKLSVVVDYFNSITKRYVDLYTIEYDIENESLFVATYTSYLVNPLVINDKEIAEHILKHFKELLHEYLMTGK